MPDPVDVHLGRRLRRRRRTIEMTQQELACLADVGSYQQISKYETAASRMSAAMLFRFAEALGVEPGYFFDGFAEPSHVRAEYRSFSEAAPRVDSPIS